MTIRETDVVTPLRPAKAKRADNTSALRQRRSRVKRKRVTPVPATAIAQIAQPGKPNKNNVCVTVARSAMNATDVTGERGATHSSASGIVVASYVAALSLATVSAFFSITGLTSIFIGAFWPVIAMGIALEIGKLCAVAWLGHHSGVASWGLRTALGALLAVLMALSAIGAYGFLAKAHIGHTVDSDIAAAGKAADIEAKISVQASIVAGIDRQIAEISSAVSKATEKGRTAAAMRLADEQRRHRADLEASHVREAKALAALQVEKAGIEGQRKVAEADLGPVRYLGNFAPYRRSGSAPVFHPDRGDAAGPCGGAALAGRGVGPTINHRLKPY
jgi:hypothetical protein